MKAIKILVPKIEVVIMAFEITERSEYREFKMVKGDTLPSVKVQFLESSNSSDGCAESYLDLTDHTVNFYFKKIGENTVLNQGHTACTIENALAGIARYDWVSGDTDNEGIHYGEFEIIDPDSKRQSIRYALRFDIRDEVASGDIA